MLDEKFWSKVRKGPDCWEWTGAKNPKGYGRYRFTGKGKAFNVHRLVWSEQQGEIPPDMEICHRCDNPSCVRPDHLFIGTRRDNALDCVTKHRFKRVNAKITPADIPKILALSAQGLSSYQIAPRFGITSSTIRAIVQGVRWKHDRLDAAGGTA